jgi:hypothetical protein
LENTSTLTFTGPVTTVNSSANVTECFILNRGAIK